MPTRISGCIHSDSVHLVGHTQVSYHLPHRGLTVVVFPPRSGFHAGFHLTAKHPTTLTLCTQHDQHVCTQRRRDDDHRCSASSLGRAIEVPFPFPYSQYLSLMLIAHWIMTPVVACHLVVRPWWAPWHERGGWTGVGNWWCSKKTPGVSTWCDPWRSVVPMIYSLDGTQHHPL